MPGFVFRVLVPKFRNFPHRSKRWRPPPEFFPPPSRPQWRQSLSLCPNPARPIEIFVRCSQALSTFEFATSKIQNIEHPTSNAEHRTAHFNSMLDVQRSMFDVFIPSPPPVIPRMARLAIRQHFLLIEGRAQEKPQKLARRVKPHLARRGQQRMPMQNHKLPSCFAR